MTGMTVRLPAGKARFEAYLDAIAAVLGHAGRVSPARAYCRGLLLPGDRKSIELIAARVESIRVRSLHQSLHHVVTKAGWDDAAVLAEVRRRVIPSIVRNNALRYFIVNEIVCGKQGIHSVGVAKQRHNLSREAENCQIAVSLWVANEKASLPVAYRLFLPTEWANDPPRRAAASVPPEIRFETKVEIALQQLREAVGEGMGEAVVLGGAEYGDDAEFRSGVEGLGLLYMLKVSAATALWPVAPDNGAEPVSAQALAQSLPGRAWRAITLYNGGSAGFRSRFAAIRVHMPTASVVGSAPEKWLLAEWPRDKGQPTEFWLSDLPSATPLKSLAWTAKSVWRTNLDCHELKHEVGLGHFEGRGWRGHHHHASLCIAAYGFLVAERCGFPARQRYLPGLRETFPPRLGFRPRGSK